MQRLPIALAEAGMVLAKDVFREDNVGGPPICGKDITLTLTLIDRLKRMGINKIVVQGHPVQMAGDKSPEEILRDLDRRFRKVGNDRLTGKLKEIYRAYLMRVSGEEDGRQAE